MTATVPTTQFDLSSIDRLPNVPKVQMNKEKTESKKEEKEKIDKAIVKLFVKNAFKSIAMIAGPHWELDKDELIDVTDACHPVMNKHWEWLAKWFSEINLALTLLRVCGPKVKKTADILAEKKKKEAEKMLERKLREQKGFVVSHKEIDGDVDVDSLLYDEKPKHKGNIVKTDSDTEDLEIHTFKDGEFHVK